MRRERRGGIYGLSGQGAGAGGGGGGQGGSGRAGGGWGGGGRGGARGRVPLGDQGGPDGQPLAHRLEGRPAEQGDALALALTADDERTAVQVHVVHIHADRLADPQAGRIKRLKKCPVAGAEGRVG